MLTKLEIRTRQGGSLMLPFADFDSGLGVSDIDGLDPVKVTMVSSGFAGKDGELYYSSRREKRNIILKIDMIPDYVENTPKSLRQRLYRYLMPKTEVTLRFYEDLGSYTDIVARVEDFNSPLFAKDPEATISLMCFDSDFFDPTPFTQQGLTVLGTDTTMTVLPYLGSVEAGLLFTMQLDRPLNAFSISHQTPSGSTYSLEFEETLLGGDKLVISTISGAMGVSLTRTNNISSLLWGVSAQSKWLELEGPGNNWFRVSASAAGVPWNIKYVNRYGGL